MDYYFSIGEKSEFSKVGERICYLVKTFVTNPFKLTWGNFRHFPRLFPRKDSLRHVCKCFDFQTFESWPSLCFSIFLKIPSGLKEMNFSNSLPFRYTKQTVNKYPNMPRSSTTSIWAPQPFTHKLKWPNKMLTNFSMTSLKLKVSHNFCCVFDMLFDLLSWIESGVYKKWATPILSWPKIYSSLVLAATIDRFQLGFYLGGVKEGPKYNWGGGNIAFSNNWGLLGNVV